MASTSTAAKLKRAWLPLLAVVSVGFVLIVALVNVVNALLPDAGRRPLKLVIDRTLSRADGASKWSTNVGALDLSRTPFDVEVKRPDRHTTQVTLTKTEQYNYRIEFWFIRGKEKGLQVEAMEGVYTIDGQPVWPLYDIVGSVKLSRDDLTPDPERPLFLAFELDGRFAGSDAPHNGFYEIPDALLR